MAESGKTVQSQVRFPASGIVLEGVFERPKGEAPVPAVVVCHPHPLYGGDMHNNVVAVICQALAQVSIATLRFNFRGVGRSEGSHEEGIGEQDDVRGALDFLQSSQGVDRGRLGLAGYSFGTKVAAPVALRETRVGALALVSPFLDDADWQGMKSCGIPEAVHLRQRGQLHLAAQGEAPGRRGRAAREMRGRVRGRPFLVGFRGQDRPPGVGLLPGGVQREP